MDCFDLVVIGGGINGVGVARDAAGRGLSVLLCEQADLASATSSSSTKLIHGGLRYLEFYEFRLVREALIEREVLLRAAPHIIQPLRFVLPHLPGLRPAWMIRAGLFLYDHLGGREILPPSNGLTLHRHPAGGPLKPDLDRAFEYSDCWVDDARLVVLNAVDAAERGAEILTRTACVGARRKGALWELTLQPEHGVERRVTARSLVNAAGPWVSRVQGEVIEGADPAALKLVKGSHVVVPRMFDHDYAYIFQNPDQRIVFAIPFEADFTLVGTTEEDYRGDPRAARIDDTEVSYLCTSMNRYFSAAIGPGDIVWSYSGVRPLYDEPDTPATTATRDYALDLEGEQGQAPLLTVLGGKLTTYRKLAEHALEKLLPMLELHPRPWTRDARLPGGDLPGSDFDGYLGSLREAHAWLPEGLARRYARAYGTRVERLLGTATSLADLGEELGPGLFGAEVSYLVHNEWARTTEDVLWRRSKLGLHLDTGVTEKLNAYLAGEAAAVGAEAMTT
jgi:glycerol-3-phosphate dehydrogenase